jgi:hypothetical protein
VLLQLRLVPVVEVHACVPRRHRQRQTHEDECDKPRWASESRKRCRGRQTISVRCKVLLVHRVPDPGHKAKQNHDHNRDPEILDEPMQPRLSLRHSALGWLSAESQGIGDCEGEDSGMCVTRENTMSHRPISTCCGSYPFALQEQRWYQTR